MSAFCPCLPRVPFAIMDQLRPSEQKHYFHFNHNSTENVNPVLPDTVWKVARDLLKSVHGTKSYTKKYTDVSHLYTIKR